jgi:hypothetical protein
MSGNPYARAANAPNVSVKTDWNVILLYELERTESA